MCPLCDTLGQRRCALCTVLREFETKFGITETKECRGVPVVKCTGDEIHKTTSAPLLCEAERVNLHESRQPLTLRQCSSRRARSFDIWTTGARPASVSSDMLRSRNARLGSSTSACTHLSVSRVCLQICAQDHGGVCEWGEKQVNPNAHASLSTPLMYQHCSAYFSSDTTPHNTPHRTQPTTCLMLIVVRFCKDDTPPSPLAVKR